MIGLTIARLASKTEEHGKPASAVASGLPALVGSCVYSFMCHHSLPSLVTPIKDKSRLLRHLAFDYSAILVFYLALALPAVFAFPTLQDLYTLNFTPQPGAPIHMEIINYFLTLFPVFTLTATFPIIAVTLRSNFQVNCRSFSKIIFILYYIIYYIYILSRVPTPASMGMIREGEKKSTFLHSFFWHLTCVSIRELFYLISLNDPIYITISKKPTYF